MIEQYAEYLFLTRLIDDLNNQVASINQQLRKNPADVMLNAAKSRISHDLKIMGAIQIQLGLGLLKHTEEKYDVSFKFFTVRKPDPKPTVQEGIGAEGKSGDQKEAKEIKLTT